MSPILVVILVLGTVLTLVTAAMAIRAGLSAFVAQSRLRSQLASEVERLSQRAGELEGRTARLERRTQELPVKIGRVQENLADLRVLTGNLYVTLAQTRRMLSYSGLKTSGTSWLSKTAQRRMRAPRG
jgi:hypothetical protein